MDSEGIAFGDDLKNPSAKRTPSLSIINFQLSIGAACNSPFCVIAQ
jgi:hypothetical protein